MAATPVIYEVRDINPTSVDGWRFVRECETYEAAVVVAREELTLREGPVQIRARPERGPSVGLIVLT